MHKYIYTFLILAACMVAGIGYNRGITDYVASEWQPVALPPSILFNRDSVLHYAEQAYLDNEPKALFITAAGYYAQANGLYPDTVSVPVIDRKTAEQFLFLSALMDYPPAIRLVRNLRANGDWPYIYPVTEP